MTFATGVLPCHFLQGALQIVELCRTFSQTLLQDFPSEVFLQSPSIVTRLLQLMQSPIAFNRRGVGRSQLYPSQASVVPCKEWEESEQKLVFESIMG
jgi:hypothetical protein